MTVDFATVSKLLRYDAETGDMYWIVKRGNRTPAGSKAGTKGKDGYIAIGIDRRYIKAHRLAWLLSTGSWPNGVIDHINGDTADNRLVNLRVATHAENCRNQARPSNNRSGYKGVHWHKRKQAYVASIRLNFKLYHLGYFDTPEDAAQAYDLASARLHGEFGRSSFKAMLKPARSTVPA